MPVKKLHVVVTRKIPEIGIKMLKQKKYDVYVNPKPGVPSRKELKTMVKGADAVLSLLTDMMDKEIMDAAGPQLKIIANYAVGYDNINLSDAKKRNIYVTNTPGFLENAVAEHTVALMFACAKRITEADRYAKAEKYHGWEPMLFLGMELYGKTLGIVGAGRIGSRVAEIAYYGLKMKIVYSNPVRSDIFDKTYKAEFLTLKELLKVSDVVSIHVPLLPSTRHLIDTKEFKLMKKTAILINTSRGPVVEEWALENALRTKRIMGAGLDVFECEPAIDCHVRKDLGFKVIPNVVLTPHTASSTVEARDMMSKIAAENIILVLSGKKPANPALEM